MKYTTVAKFRRKVDQYFASISTEEMLPNGYTVRVWLRPPSIAGLMRFLGIRRRETWAEYKRRPGYDEVCEDASLVIEEYNIERSYEKDSARGAIFNLQANYGYSEKHEVEVGEKTREVMQEGASLSEKLAAIRSAAALIGGEDADDGQRD